MVIIFNCNLRTSLYYNTSYQFDIKWKKYSVLGIFFCSISFYGKVSRGRLQIFNNNRVDEKWVLVSYGLLGTVLQNLAKYYHAFNEVGIISNTPPTHFLFTLLFAKTALNKDSYHNSKIVLWFYVFVVIFDYKINIWYTWLFHLIK